MSKLLILKLAALLHDPAWKPWILSAAFKGPQGRVGRVLALVEGEIVPAGLPVCKDLVVRYNERYKEKDAHILDAAAATRKILEPLKDEVANEAEKAILAEDGLVDEADRLASSVDRWLITYVFQQSRRIKVEVRDVSYANPLDPRFTVELKESIHVMSVCNYVSKLRSLMNNLRGLPLPLIYNALYLLLEPYWYDSCNECVPLADTRTPTHTVFDHVYATTTTLNWLYPYAKLRGFLVKIDIAGIQKFVSAARKIMDLWAGSWLVSALTWYAVSEAVMVLGGDVILSPYNPANHFFIATLLKELEEQKEARKQNQDVESEVLEKTMEEIERCARQAYLWFNAPSQPIVPGTFFLALPCIDDATYEALMQEIEGLKTINKDLAKKLLEALKKCDEEGEKEVAIYFYEKFREGWNKVYESVKSVLHALIQLTENDAEKEARKTYIDSIKCRPPLQLRVVVVRVDEAYERLRKEIEKFKDRIRDIGVDEASRKLLFSWLFHKALTERESKLLLKNISLEPGYSIAKALEEFTENSKYHECSVCGKLPAVVRFDSELLRKFREYGKECGLPLTLFTEGESLCPYCLIKRLLAVKIKEVMRNLNLYCRGTPRGPPSTLELASLNALLALVDALAKDEFRRELRRKIEHEYRYEGGYLPKIVEQYAYRKYGSSAEEILAILEYVWRLLEGYGEELPHVIVASYVTSVDKCKEALGKSITYQEPQEEIQKLCDVLAELYKEVRNEVSRYYAIIRGDGDFFGKRIVVGILDFKEPREYVEHVVATIRNDEIRKDLRDLMLKVVEPLISIAGRIIYDVKNPTVIVTPAYYMALSRGQMITAVYDAEIVRCLGGFTVYAGGDDVAAISPSYINPERLKTVVEITLDESPAKDILRKALENIVAENGSGFVPGLIILCTRRNFWGLLRKPGKQVKHGFHVTPICAVYPAPAAYGRSYGVYIVHYRDPFMAAWRTAGELEELKDLIVFKEYDPRLKCKPCRAKKDAIFLGYGRVPSLIGAKPRVTVLVNLKPSQSKEDVRVNPGIVGKALGDAIYISHLVHEENSVSKSLYSDILRECYIGIESVKRLLRDQDDFAITIAFSILAKLIERNTRNAKVARELVKRVKNYMYTMVIPCEFDTGISIGKNECLLSKYVSIAYTPLTCIAPLPWQIILAARVLSSGMR